MPNSASSLLNFVRDVEAIPSPFACLSSTRYPFPSFAHESASPSAPSEAYPKSHVSAARLPVFSDSPYCVKNGDIWRCVVRMTTKGKARSRGLLGRKIEGIRSEKTVPAWPMYVLEVTWGNLMDSRVELRDEVGSCGVFCPFQVSLPTNQLTLSHIYNPQQSIHHATSTILLSPVT
jgi:hypothetical protein